MAQIKKAAVRERILDAAFRLFREHGYAPTTVSMIATEAGVSTANVYVYFSSKFRIVSELHDAWFRARIEALRLKAEVIAAPRARVIAVLHALWCEIPRLDNGFANCFMEAISTLGSEEAYEPALLEWAEAQIAAMLRPCLGASGRLDLARVARLALMAFDGFVIGSKLRPAMGCDHATIEQMADLLLLDRAVAVRAQGVPPDTRSDPRARPGRVRS